MRATRRTWNVNLQWVTLNIDGKPTRVRISTRTLRTLRKGQKKVAAPVAPSKSEAPVASAPQTDSSAPVSE